MPSCSQLKHMFNASAAFQKNQKSHLRQTFESYGFKNLTTDQWEKLEWKYENRNPVVTELTEAMRMG